MKFVAGKLEFALTALPIELLYTLRLFAAAREGNLSELAEIIETSKSAACLSNISVQSNLGVDVNVHYTPPSYFDDAFFGPNSNRRKSSIHVMRHLAGMSPLSPTFSGFTYCDSHRLLLHIAIDQENLEMVSYLLSENADVRMLVDDVIR